MFLVPGRFRSQSVLPQYGKYFSICVFLFGFSPVISAQSAATANLTGIIADSSGSVIPGAAVEVTNVATGLERNMRSDSLGKYTFTSLPVGEYTLVVSHDGFRKFSQSGIRLNVNVSATVDVQLEVGDVGQSVSVTADASMVNTQSGTLSQVVQQRYIESLPLNGRNAASLILMVPGTVSNSGQTTAGYANSSETISISVNGSRGNEVSFRLDGATHMDNVTNLNAALPNPDALQEFNVQTSNFSAQYGNFAGGVVNVVTKSGTNQHHGSAFYFVRNGAMNARNFFAAQSDNLKRNQLGFTMGGPIVKNKLFYFSSYQGTIVRNESFTNTAIVPSQAMRNGDFSALSTPIRDAVTGEEFLDKIIPSHKIRQISSNLLSKVPTTSDPTGLLRYARPDRSSTHQGLAKLDYLIGNHQLSGSMFITRLTDPGWNGGGTLLTTRIGQEQTTKSFKLQDVYTISPRMVNTLIASGLMLDSTNIRTSTFWLSQFGPLQYSEPEEAFRELELGVTGYAGWGSVSNAPPGQWVRRNVEISDTLTVIAGRHTLAFGGEYTPVTWFDSDTKFQQSGNFTFSGQLSGNGIADLLQGRAAAFTQSAGKFKQTRGQQFSLFAEDSFRATSNLTLTFGVRWDPYLPYHDKLDQVSGYQAGAQSQRFVNAPPGAIFAGDPGFPRSGMNNNLGNVAPRFGFAWQPTKSGSTVVRGGYGMFYLRPFPRLYNNFVESAPFSPTITLNSVDMQDPYGSSGVRNAFPPFAPVDLSDRNQPFSFPMPYAYFQRDWRVGYSQAWNLTVEHQVAKDWLIRAAYVGNKGTRLQSFRERNAAVYEPGATVGNTNARRPLAPYFSSMKELVDAGNSNYHSMQLTLDKRFSSNFSILTFYTWSKSIDDESANNQFVIANPNPFNQRFNRGVSDFDIPHSFRLTGTFDLPRLQSSSTALRMLAGGWSILSMIDLRSGTPFSLISGRDNSFTGIGLDRADLLGNPVLSSDRSKQERIANYFDKSMVSANAVGTFGNAPRNFMRSNGFFNIDMAVQKTFSVMDRMNIQLRGEFFNLLNHANLNAPGANVSSTGDFGRITSARDPRILQLGTRITF